MKKVKSQKTRQDSLWELICSVKLTVFLLILLALTSILGTLIQQNAPAMEYIRQFGPGLYRFLNLLGLFDMYHSWWFRGIIVLLAMNILACSSARLPRIWRRITRPRSEIDKVQNGALPYAEELNRSFSPEEVAEKAISIIKRMFGKPLVSESSKAIVVFAERGRLTRLGVYITHLSILIILSGALIGSLFGFRGFITIPEGDVVDRVLVRQRRGMVPKAMGFQVRCDDFRITYYDVKPQERLVKEYVSALTFLEDGREVMKKEVRVNHPLAFHGLRFYQSTYGSIPEISLTIVNENQGRNFSLVAHEGERVEIPGSDVFFEVLKYHPQIHDFGEGVAVAFFRSMAMPQRFWLLKVRPKIVDGYQFTLKEVTQREYTGLQVTRDPGVWAVWVGCILLVWGLMVAFFSSHQRIWVLILKGKATVVVSGTANKNRTAFERRFRKTIAALKGAV